MQKEELIDVIDEDENIIRVAPKSEIISKNLIRKGAKILVFNSQGKLLIHKRALVLKHEPNKWELVFGGWVSSGEKPEPAATRELAEEIGAKNVRLTFLLKYRLKHIQINQNDISYLYKAIWDKKIIPEKKEVAAIEWVSQKDLGKLLSKRKFTLESYFIYKSYKERIFDNSKNQKQEYVYHVDENDKVIGKVSRKEMRRKTLLHRGSDIFVFNSKGEILVHKRTLTKDLFPGYYAVVIGGSASYGETYDECAKREISEEIGIKNPKLEFLFKQKYIGPKNKFIGNVYKIVHNGPFKFQKEEISWAEFMPLSTLKLFRKNNKFCPDDIAVFEKYLKEYHGKK